MTDADKVQLVLDTLRSIVQVLNSAGPVDPNTTDPALQFRYAFQLHALHIKLSELLVSLDEGEGLKDKDQALLALRLAVNAAIKAENSPEVINQVVTDQLFGIEHIGHGDPDEMLRNEAAYEREARENLRKWYHYKFEE